MTELTSLTLGEARDGLRSRRFSAVELADAHLAAMETARALNAYVLETPDAARAMASAADARLATGDARPLEGIPLGVKDLFATLDVRTTACSRILGDFAPPYESTVTANLWRDGAVMLGKLNNDEFAMGSSNETSVFGPVTSPWRRKGANTPLVPGGSSGGSAALVAAGAVPAALGSDTGGSVRQPAALCGLVGLKPTYGRVSRYGLVAYASSLDQIGPITWTVADAALLMNVIAGHDRKDSTSVPDPVPNYLTELSRPLANVRIGIAREHQSGAGVDPQVKSAVDAAIKQYKSLGAQIVEVSLPHTEYGIAAYYVIAPCEASSNLARYDGVHFGHRTKEQVKDIIELFSKSRAEGFGEEVQRRIMLGTYALSSGYYDAYYVSALKMRALIKRDFDQAFEKCDVIASPTSPTAAFTIGEKTADPLQMYMSDVFTVTCNIASIPGISLPCGFTSGSKPLPIGLQLLGPTFSESRLLQIAHLFESSTEWHKQRYYRL